MIKSFKRIVKRGLFLCSLLVVAAIYFWAFADGSASGNSQFRLLSFNVFGMKHSTGIGSQDLVLDGILAMNPDLLVLQECPLGKRFMPIRLSLEAHNLSYHATFPYHDNNTSGLAIFSRFPIKQSREVELPPASEGRSMGMIQVELDGRELWLGDLHLANSDIHLLGGRASLYNEIFGENLRTIQASAVLAVVENLGEQSLIIAGDFNTFPMSASWRMIRGKLLDAFDPTDWFTGTFQLRPEVEVKIDHIFHTKDLESIEARVLNLPGSDHKPVMADFRY